MKTYEQALGMIVHMLQCAERSCNDSMREYYDDKAWGMSEIVAYIYSDGESNVFTNKVYREAVALLKDN